MEVQNNVNLYFSIHIQEQSFVSIISLRDLNSIILQMRYQIFRFYVVVKDEKLVNEAIQVAEQKLNFIKNERIN